jgi:hypothetical protein
VIVTEFYRGQGLGNQLWMYAVTRVLAESRGWEFGIQSPGRFKGRAFMEIDFGRSVTGSSNAEPSDNLPREVTVRYLQKRVRHPVTGADISPLDANLADIADGTKLDGNFEAEDYLLERRDDIRRWFTSTIDLAIPDDVCAISLRGGEYRYHPDLLLPRNYYTRAMSHVKDVNPAVEFVVVTDDRGLAHELLPGVKVVSHRRLPDLRRFGIQPSSKAIGGDFTWLQRARYLILSNSSFSWWGAWTNPLVETVIAPKYWARHNVSDGYWSPATAITRGWLWQDRDGSLQTADECATELASYLRAVEGDSRES